MAGVRVRRAILSVSDKTGIVDLARAFSSHGTELFASGGTKRVLNEAGILVEPIEALSGNPEAFAGRMKTLSFEILSAILFRRGDVRDEADATRLGIQAIDAVVVNFYPFEEALREGRSGQDLVEEIDIGGPTLVRAAAKNAPDTLVLTDPGQYGAVIEELQSSGIVSEDLAIKLAQRAWERVRAYDDAIAYVFGERLALRYGENPHQSATLTVESSSPIAWPMSVPVSTSDPITPNALSFNNILDLSSAYELMSELHAMGRGSIAVIVKHNQPCGVSFIPSSGQLLEALKRAWEGDEVSAFGGVIALNQELDQAACDFLSNRFIELVAAPGLDGTHGREAISKILATRKKIKAVSLHRLDRPQGQRQVSVVGGRLSQSADSGTSEELRSVTRMPWDPKDNKLALFGIAVCRALRSNAIALVREVPSLPGSFQLVGAGQGQPNRIEALEKLAIPRALKILAHSGGNLSDCVLVSDAFFPFRDSVNIAAQAGLRKIVQPGGSIKDRESVSACDSHGVAMAFTGVRHFRH